MTTKESTAESGWPYTSNTFLKGLEDTLMISERIRSGRATYATWYPPDQLAFIGSFFKPNGEELDNRKLTPEDFRKTIRNPPQDTHVSLYFIASLDARAIYSSHFLDFLSKFDVPVAVVKCWLQGTIGAYGYHIQRNTSGQVVAIHSWSKYWLRYSPKEQDPDMLAGWKSRVHRRVQFLEEASANVSFYSHWSASTGCTTMIFDGPTTLYNQLRQSIIYGQGTNTPFTPSLLFSSQAIQIIERYTNRVLQSNWDGLKNVLWPTNLKILLERQQMADHVNVTSHRIITSIRKDLTKLKRLLQDCSREVPIDPIVEKQEMSFLEGLEEQASSLEDQCTIILDHGARNLNTLLSNASLQSIQAMVRQAEATKALTIETKYDTAIMRTIAVVTMIFLPPTALALAVV